MKTLHVGGISLINRCKTLQEAINKAKDDDKIIIHKTIKESVSIDKDIIIEGNGNKFHVESNTVGLVANKNIVIDNLEFIIKTRSNGLILNSNSKLTNIKTKIIGPVRKFFPTIHFGNGKHNVSNSILNNLGTEDESKIIFKNCTLYNYYGGNIHLNNYEEYSVIKGQCEFYDSNLSHCYLDNAYINNSKIGAFVDVENANIINCEFSQSNLEVNINLKKEEQFDLLNDKSDSKYCLKINDSCDIVNYKSNIEDNNYVMIYSNGCTLNISDTNHNNNTTAIIKNSSVKFTNTKDSTYWKLENSKFSKVRSTINTNASDKSGLEKLDELIGLESVKKQIKSIANTIQRNQQSSNKNFEFSYHMIFAGAPGVGKTTVGKLISEILYEIGAIPENKFTEATVDSLIKGYVGQTADNTRQILDKALGGVLFIDEAYQLTVKEGQNTFNDEALSVLIRYMEEHRDNLVVIAAGYSKEMQEFLASNIGLSRRFQWIEFDDYNATDMYKIFELMRKSHNVEYDNFNYEEVLTTVFNNLIKINLQIPDANGRVTNGGNGGLVRNVFQRIMQASNNRIVETKSNNHNITKDDVMTGYKEEIITIKNKQITNRG